MSSIQSTTFQGNNNVYTKQELKDKKKKDTAGIFAAATVANALNLVQNPISNGITNNIRKLNIYTDTNEIVGGLCKALEVSKMKDAGVKIIVPDKVKNLPKNASIIDRITDLYKSALRPLTVAGRNKNAFYCFETNEIYLRPNQLGTTGFHEIGHAINRNSSKFWKAMQKLRIPGTLIGSLILLTAIMKKPKAEGEKPEGVLDKTGTFVKDNAGKLTILAGLPVFAEEMMASIRGNRLAQEVLSPDIAKKVFKTNKCSAAIYGMGLLVSGLVAYSASKVRDYFYNKNQKA